MKIKTYVRKNAKRIKVDKRRGAVMEWVLFIMTVIFLMSALLTSMTVIAHNHKEKSMRSLKEKVQIETVIESCLSDFKADQNVDGWSSGEYTATQQTNENIITVTVKKGEKTVATVTLKKDGDNFVITSWEV